MIVILLALISMVAYRCGGMDSQTKHWIPVWLRQSWVRDWLCPLLVVIPLFITTKAWQSILVYFFLAASLSTYWDWMFDNEDNLWFSGFMCGMSLFPLLFAGYNWHTIVVKSVLLALIWGGTNRIVNNNRVPHSDFIEEYARGFSLVLVLLA